MISTAYTSIFPNKKKITGTSSLLTLHLLTKTMSKACNQQNGVHV